MPNIQLAPTEWKVLVMLLEAFLPNVKVWAFGSRVKLKARKNSDLDLVAFTGPEFERAIASLKEAFEESDLPFPIDLHVWSRVPQQYQVEIQQNYLEIQSTKALAGVRLGEIADVVMGQSPAGESCNANREGLPLLNGPTEFGAYHPTPTQWTKDPRKQARPKDLLFCVRGSTTGRMNWADQQYAIGRGLAAIRHKSDPELQPLVRAVFDYELPGLLLQATGSTFPNVSRDQIMGLKWPSLSPEAEKRASQIIGSLDDKIELNRRMAATLEEMARALFKSWFVDFDPVRAKAEGRPTGLPPDIDALFPDELVESELGLIPKGWSIGTVGEYFKITMGQSPPGNTYNAEGNGMPFYQGKTDFGFRFPTPRMYCTAPTRIAEAGDVLISVRAPVGAINMATERCCIGRGVGSALHKTGSQSFTFHGMGTLSSYFAQFDGEGTVFGSMSKKDFESIPFIEPSLQIVAAFEHMCRPIDAKVFNAESESRALSALRDTLIPKLLSGELGALQ